MKRGVEQIAGAEIDEAKRRNAENENSKMKPDNMPAALYDMTCNDVDKTQCSSSFLSQKKLFLVLDLDHTLLNSIPFAKLDQDEALRISSLVFDNTAGVRDNNLDIHALPNLRIFTKLRPFVHQFLCQASTMFQMYVYTMGNRAYAEAMVRLLDPSRCFFGNRIISRDDNKCSNATKSLDFISAPASATIVLDDSHRVWPGFLANLIQIERYHFFNASSKQFGPSLLGALKDESNASGTLVRTLHLLRKVHHAFLIGEADSQKSSAPNENDVRHILHGLRSNLLAGCKIVFSTVFPLESDPKVHPLWRLAEQLGAVCATTLDDSVTHVVAYHAGTEKARWACQYSLHLVHPRWIEATYFTWKRPSESDYAVAATDPMLSTFSEMTTLLQENACHTGLNVPTQLQNYGVGTATMQCCG